MTTSEMKTTPMMAQWQECKEAAGEAVLLFRMGDFYEAFYEDAEILAKELELTLTRRQDVPMSGVPHHSSETYIDKLVSKGYRVAIAEQTSDPKSSKGLVDREVVRVVTPGTLITSSLLTDKSNNFFASLTQVGNIYGLAFVDLTTGDFRVCEFDNEQALFNEIYRIQPAELLTSKRFTEKHSSFFEKIRHTFNFLHTTEENWQFEHQVTSRALINHFNVHNLDGFGLQGMVVGINAAGALLNYIQDTLKLSFDHVTEICPYTTLHFMALDHMTQSNLELTRSLQDGSQKNTLLSILDNTQTPMGGRLIQSWVKQPLLDPITIHQRQDAIEAFVNAEQLLIRIQPLLGRVRDIERLIMKISSNYATPRDIVALRLSMEPLPQLKAILLEISQNVSSLSQSISKINSLPEMTHLIERALIDDPPLRVSDGNIIRDGFHQELDELREISRNSKAWIARYQNDLKEQTGIKTLKVGFNRMFGYYIEVSKGQAERTPESFQRRQTLVNAERYITPELKDYEQKVMTAEEKIGAMEAELFQSLRKEIAKYSKQVIEIAQALAHIDCIQGLAEAAKRNHYTRPCVDESDTIEISDGRHPVVEASAEEKFTPNDTLLNHTDSRLLLITGPNMAGKSTYIRQVALITIMAQIGSFVPAKKARIGIVDKVFTRIGASDNLSKGQSTFMVEMTETANILNNATSRSLVILDEIGRGTSTYDGISIAWSVAEHLLLTEGKAAKTLFATHYWELTKLEEQIPGAVNYNVAVHESDDHIIFLRKIIRGGTDKSYGIHVGRLAGLPLPVIERAKEILIHLEENANRKNVFEPSKAKRKVKTKSKTQPNHYQLTFFG